MSEPVRPGYYGGPDNAYETIKVIRAWGLNFDEALYDELA